MLIGKEAFCLRTYVCDNKKIENIKIFNTSGVVYESGQGWLERKSSMDSNYSSRDVIQLELPGLKRKVKENFAIKHPYRIKDVIYIPASLVKFKSLGEHLVLETETDKHYHKYYSVTLKCRLHSYDFEKDTDYDELLQRTVMVSTRYYTKTEKTPLGTLVASIKEKTGVGSWDIEQILEHYNIVEKKGRS